MHNNFQIDDKENIPILDNVTPVNLRFQSINLNPLAMHTQPQLLHQGANCMSSQKSKGKGLKVQKNLNNSVRAGDWICLVCNNLNFSFRNECNRCQMQTKKQNYIQNLMLISEKKNMMLADQILNNNRMECHTNNNGNSKRVLRDLTNIPQEVFQEQHQNYNPKLNQNIRSLHCISEGCESAELTPHNHPTLPPGLSASSNCGLFDSHIKLEKDHNSSQDTKFDEFEFSPNYGFENAILLTPPRFTTHTKDYASPILGLNETIKLLPYQSPRDLPSVSPILRKVLSYGDASNGEEICNVKYLKYKTVLQRGNSPSDKCQEDKSNEFVRSASFGNNSHHHSDTKHHDDDDNGSNGNFDEINKCIQETISDPKYASKPSIDASLLLDFSSFNTNSSKENLNPMNSTIQKNFNILFPGINMEISIDSNNNGNSNVANTANVVNDSNINSATNNNSNDLSESSNRKKQPKKERKADWVCIWCSNLNYSFRKFCNRCQAIRESKNSLQ